MLVTVDRYCKLTGRTEYAVRSYINKGVWACGVYILSFWSVAIPVQPILQPDSRHDDSQTNTKSDPAQQQGEAGNRH